MILVLQIGSHVNYGSREGLTGCVRDTILNGGNAFMFYTGAPQNTKRSPIDTKSLQEAKQQMEESHIPSSNVIVHAPYIINLANRLDEEKWYFAIHFLEEEIKRVHQFGFSYLVLHPGSHVKQGADVGIQNIIDALNIVLKDTKDYPVMILLETMAGKGTEIGKTMEELKEIYEGIDEKERIGICLDTCHLHDAGYDLTDFDAFLDLFTSFLPLSLIHCIHINDSKNERGSHKDRHENFGFGKIGFDTLLKIVFHEKLKDVPKILETPYINHLYAPYQKEIEMIKSKTFNAHLFDEEKKTL